MTKVGIITETAAPKQIVVSPQQQNRLKGAPISVQIYGNAFKACYLKFAILNFKVLLDLACGLNEGCLNIDSQAVREFELTGSL